MTAATTAETSNKFPRAKGRETRPDRLTGRNGQSPVPDVLIEDDEPGVEYWFEAAEQ